ncbi:MAG TPA: cytochrome c family protein [Acetobacteraceae bacterium]|nr:cytochrome c family protein [Acetobacteraceae bacterium]
MLKPFDLALLAAFATLPAALAAPAHAAGDAAAGKSVFQSSCSICHSAQPGQNRVGPTLYGVVGRKTGSVPGYAYSPANQSANITWDAATLDKYLANPRAMIPGTKMTYAGLSDPAKRADLIAYLATLK